MAAAASLKALIQRLEAAVDRLEALDVNQLQMRLNSPVSGGGGGAVANGVPSEGSAAAGAGGGGTAPTPAPKREIIPPSVAHAAAAAAAALEEPEIPVPPSVADFDEIIKNQVARVISWAEKIGGKVSEVSKLLETAFVAERKILLMMTQCKAPGMQTITSIAAPIVDCITKANTLNEGKRTDHFNHLKAASESMQALTWVLFTGKDCGISMPTGHVTEMWQTAEFYCNKVLVEFKSKDPNSVQWCRSLKDLYLNALLSYVKKHHTTGPSWKPDGVDVSDFKEGGGGEAAQRQEGAGAEQDVISPAPLRPRAFGGGGGAAGDGGQDAGTTGSQAAERGNLFAELNKGEGITKGLRKVSDDLKTKNRPDRSGVVPAGAVGPSPAAAAPETPRGGGGGGGGGGSVRDAAARLSPPMFELINGRKWTVENQVNRRDLVINGQSRQSVYIYGCKGCLVRVEGKVNNITMDKCVRTSLVFQDVVSACEVVNSSGVEVQCQGAAQTFAVDNAAGCQLYISKQSLNAAITTSKSSEVNVYVPGPTGDFVEHHLPEQFMNTFQSGKFVTIPVAGLSYGGEVLSERAEMNGGREMAMVGDAREEEVLAEADCLIEDGPIGEDGVEGWRGANGEKMERMGGDGVMGGTIGTAEMGDKTERPIGKDGADAWRMGEWGKMERIGVMRMMGADGLMGGDGHGERWGTRVISNYDGDEDDDNGGDEDDDDGAHLEGVEGGGEHRVKDGGIQGLRMCGADFFMCLSR
ncbi:hypothetical protein CBR_g21060 [Chara braunii]|uniref:C-CAP/cofactor C-like domain-containing protein n=1 Tax=Chara braunii TaxID=69332 RepID=A0A388L0J7_CHABU|nr:hypothetical protein CBR_g21060 [Chara braunii]|eukprot:GBG75815.1 hypothetical protein CBR_g21060 [Chara braunii]